MNRLTGSVILTRAEIAAIRAAITPVHREVTKNANYREVVQEIEQTGVIPGTILLCTIMGVGRTAIDGNHRLEGSLETSRDSFSVDVTDYGTITLEAFATAYLNANKAIKPPTVGDKLRARTQHDPKFAALMGSCTWLTYLNDKNKAHVPVQSVLSASRASLCDNPTGRSVLSQDNLLEDLDWLPEFLSLCEKAWPLSNPFNKIYYNVLNLSLTAWLYLRITDAKSSAIPSKRVTKITKEEFMRCMMSVTADNGYRDWLPRKTLEDQSRREGYTRLKAIFSAKISTLRNGINPALPAPNWSRKAQKMSPFQAEL